MQKSRWILQTLILSVALNAAFLCTFFYFLIRNNPLHFSYHPTEEIYSEPPPCTAAFLERLHTLEFEQLVNLLGDTRQVEYGYAVRDFALGALVFYHEFDVERGVSRGLLSKRKWEYDGKTFLLFPGLKNEDFNVLKNFAFTEKWPFTTKGLFKRICQIGIEKSDPLLLSFFCHSPHFMLLETLFARTQLPIQRKSILNLALEGGWEKLDSFYMRQHCQADFSPSVRQNYLLDSLHAGSTTAAYLLLITDAEFAQKRLDDMQVMQLLDSLALKTEEALQFAVHIAHSPRSDWVREKALARIAAYTGQTQEELAGHFYEKPGLKQLRPVFRDQPPAAPDPNVHIIQPGESLWLIARKYRLSPEVLMEVNHLQSTVIQPGKTLKIPPP